jgi:hypothetical protein
MADAERHGGGISDARGRERDALLASVFIAGVRIATTAHAIRTGPLATCLAADGGDPDVVLFHSKAAEEAWAAVVAVVAVERELLANRATASAGIGASEARHAAPLQLTAAPAAYAGLAVVDPVAVSGEETRALPDDAAAAVVHVESRAVRRIDDVGAPQDRVP